MNESYLVMKSLTRFKRESVPNTYDKWIKHSLQANNRIIWSIHLSVRASRQNKLAEEVTDMWQFPPLKVCRTKQLKQPEEISNCNWQWWHYIQAWHYIQTVRLLVSFWVHLVLFLLAPHKITRIVKILHSNDSGNGWSSDRNPSNDTKTPYIQQW